MAVFLCSTLFVRGKKNSKIKIIISVDNGPLDGVQSKKTTRLFSFHFCKTSKRTEPTELKRFYSCLEKKKLVM